MSYPGMKREDLQRKVQNDKDFKKKLDARKVIRKSGSEGPTGNAPHYHDTSLEKLYRDISEYDVLPDSYGLDKYEVRAVFNLLKSIYE